MQTTTDYIFEQLEENSLFFRGTDNELNISISASDYFDLKRLANKMFEQQMINAVNIDKRQYDNAQQYYNKTYGSKGSDENHAYCGIIDCKCTTSSKTEISDEEIVQKALEVGFTKTLFIDGAKWYREQLKKKQ